MNNTVFKISIFIFLIISLTLIILHNIFGISISFLAEEEIKENRTLKVDLIDSISINNTETIYDKMNNIYYYTITDKYENNNYVLKLNLDNGYKYKILNTSLNIIKIDYSKPIDIIIYNEKYYYETKIQLTNLPLINITTPSTIGSTDVNSSFTYINSENINKIITTNSEIHVRGATAKNFDKKSYKLNFCNDSCTKDNNIIISDFYYGSAFILDAVYRDPSKIRNVLSINLWNLISKDFTELNIDSEFVELFINNEYKGLYVFTETVNRRNLNLNKEDDINYGVVLKANSWNKLSNTMNFKDLSLNNFYEYELKYPNDEDYHKDVWNQLINKLGTFYDNYYKITDKLIEETFDINNYIDLIIFNAFINNSDNNFIKNNYFYYNNIENFKINIQPWDMEYSFGLNYSSENEMATLKNLSDYNLIYTSFYHDEAKNLNELIIKRYWNLRKNILTKEYFDNILNNYKNELSKGSALRDSNIWYEYDIDLEIEDIRTWIYNRLDYFDEYVRSLENE